MYGVVVHCFVVFVVASQAKDPAVGASGRCKLHVCTAYASIYSHTCTHVHRHAPPLCTQARTYTHDPARIHAQTCTPARDHNIHAYIMHRRVRAYACIGMHIHLHLRARLYAKTRHSELDSGRWGDGRPSWKAHGGHPLASPLSGLFQYAYLVQGYVAS